MRRFFLDKDKMIDSETVLIDGEEYQHLNKVLRIKPGEIVAVCFGDGFTYETEIVESFKDKAHAKIISKTENNANPKHKVTVFQAVLKGDKNEFLAQKLGELGISELAFFENKFSTANADSIKTQRLNKISISASKQCGRSDKMNVSICGNFNDLLSILPKYEKVIFAYEKEKIKHCKDVEMKGENIAIIVGSEGGFSEEEVLKITKLDNAEIISLGSRILRAETATICMSCLVMQTLGEI